MVNVQLPLTFAFPAQTFSTINFLERAHLIDGVAGKGCTSEL